ALRDNWILGRGDVEEYDGRTVKPIDDGFLSDKQRENSKNISAFGVLTSTFPLRRPLRACAGHPVTQLWYARQGIITPEMEYIAIGKNLGRPKMAKMPQATRRDYLDKQHAGSAQLTSPYPPSIFNRFPQRIPAEITPEFVRSEVADGRAIIPSNINHPE